MKAFVYICVDLDVHFFVDIYPRVEYLGYRANLCLLWVDTANSFTEWSEWVSNLYSSQQWMRISVPLHGHVFRTTRYSGSAVVSTCAYNSPLPNEY